MGDLSAQIDGIDSRSILDCPLMAPKGCAMVKLWSGDWSGLEREYSVEGFNEGRTKQHTKVASCKICGHVFADSTQDYFAGDQFELGKSAYAAQFTDQLTGGAEKNRLYSQRVLEVLAGRLGYDQINYGARAYVIFRRMTEANMARGRSIALLEAVAMFLAIVNQGNTRLSIKEVCEAHTFSLIQSAPSPVKRDDWGNLSVKSAERLLRDAVRKNIVEYTPVRDVETIIRGSDVARKHMDEEAITRALEISERNKTVSRSKTIAAAATYMALKEVNASSKITQKQIAHDFGVAERSLRHSIKATKESMYGPTPKRNPGKATGSMPGSYVRLLRDLKSHRNDELS
jgi:transcription initiation factor TFIIIB Brf1 subunit/transcription initiation factor TFIIB